MFVGSTLVKKTILQMVKCNCNEVCQIGVVSSGLVGVVTVEW